MKPKAHKYRITNLDILRMVKRANREHQLMPKATVTKDRKKDQDKNRCRTKDKNQDDGQ